MGDLSRAARLKLSDPQIRAYRAELIDIIRENGQDALDELGGGDFEVSGKLQRWVERETRRFLERLNDGVRNLDRDVEEAENAREALEDFFDGRERRAEMGARTGTTAAANIARLEAASTAGVERHRWFTQADGAVRPSHEAIHGQRRPIGEEFSNGCRYPGDPDAPIEETANCRCYTEAVVRKTTARGYGWHAWARKLGKRERRLLARILAAIREQRRRARAAL